MLRLIIATIYFSFVASPLHAKELDWQLWERWEAQVKPQRFPIVTSSKQVIDGTRFDIPAEQRQRFIFQVPTALLQDLTADVKKLQSTKFDVYGVRIPNVGNFLIAVPDQWKKCFRDAKKKFDGMQMVAVADLVTELGSPIMSVELPRQCDGTVKDTGGLLAR
jgi:hypothetical protein